MSKAIVSISVHFSFIRYSYFMDEIRSVFRYMRSFAAKNASNTHACLEILLSQFQHAYVVTNHVQINLDVFVDFYSVSVWSLFNFFFFLLSRCFLLALSILYSIIGSFWFQFFWISSHQLSGIGRTARQAICLMLEGAFKALHIRAHNRYALCNTIKYMPLLRLTSKTPDDEFFGLFSICSHILHQFIGSLFVFSTFYAIFYW